MKPFHVLANAQTTLKTSSFMRIPQPHIAFLIVLQDTTGTLNIVNASPNNNVYITKSISTPKRFHANQNIQVVSTSTLTLYNASKTVLHMNSKVKHKKYASQTAISKVITCSTTTKQVSAKTVVRKDSMAISPQVIAFNLVLTATNLRL